jgi:hypothetical protein
MLPSLTKIATARTIKEGFICYKPLHSVICKITNCPPSDKYIKRKDFNIRRILRYMEDGYNERVF